SFRPGAPARSGPEGARAASRIGGPTPPARPRRRAGAPPLAGRHGARRRPDGGEPPVRPRPGAVRGPALAGGPGRAPPRRRRDRGRRARAPRRAAPERGWAASPGARGVAPGVTPEVVFRPVRELAGLVRRRRVSPVALAETFLARRESLGPRYNAVVTVTRARALAEARRAERDIAAGRWRGPLHGIPYGAKDLLAPAGGIPTTWGAAPLRRQRFDHDATVIRKLGAAGAVLVAKL